MVTFFPSNPASSAAVQAYVRAGADTDVANIRAAQAAAEAQAQMENQNQQRFFQQQQAQQQNDLQRQQIANQDFFNRGRLTNEGKSLDAQLAQGQIALSEAEKDRQLKRDLNRNPTDWHTQDLNAQLDAWDSQAEAAANRFNTLWDSEKKAQEFAVRQAQEKRGNEWFTSKSTAADEAKKALDAIQAIGFNGFLQKIQQDPDSSKVIWENGVAKPKKVARTSFFNSTRTTSGAAPMGLPAIDQAPITAPPVGLPSSGGYWNSPTPSVAAPVALPQASVGSGYSSGAVRGFTPSGSGYSGGYFNRTAPSVNAQAVLAEAHAAIQSGKDPVAVRQRLLQMNINPDF